MRVGIQLPEVEREVRWPEVKAIALTAEQTGFDSIWVGDHLLFRDPVTGTRGPWEAWAMLAALAEATETVNLGPLVAATSFHSPAMLAKKAATVDEISGGRLILGLGAGWNRAEYEAFGFAYDHRVSRFAEAFHIIRTLLADGAIDFQGRFYDLAGTELLPRPRTDIPLMIGSNGPRMLGIALPHVQMWNTWYASYGNTVEGLKDLIEKVDAVAHEVGRDPATFEHTTAVLVETARGKGRVAGSTERPDTPPIPVAGLGEHLDRLWAIGVSRVQLVIDPIDVAAVEEVAHALGRPGRR